MLFQPLTLVMRPSEDFRWREDTKFDVPGFSFDVLHPNYPSGFRTLFFITGQAVRHTDPEIFGKTIIQEIARRYATHLFAIEVQEVQPTEGNVSMNDSSEVMTPGQVATMFGVNPKTISRWSRSGKLPSFRTPGGHRRFDRTAMEELKDSLVVRGEDTDDAPADH